jgi:light-independent protochlorophyllide reductase subunit B
VISAPVHVQDFPARYSPQMGFEGANVIFDAWVHPLMMGLEEHLLGMFRGDFEFRDDVAASHLGVGHGSHKTAAKDAPIIVAAPAPHPAEADPVIRAAAAQSAAWTLDAEKELKKIPFFVRGKARRNTERFAAERGVTPITVETLYDAKAHFGR